MKRKLLVGMMVAVLAFAMTACGGTQDTVNPSDEQSVEDTVEILEEESEGTSVEESSDAVEEETVESESEPVLTGELTFDVPEGFEFDAQSNTYKYTADATVAANINSNSIASDGSFSMITKELMATALEAQLESVFGSDITLDIPVYENMEISGRPTVKYTITYEIGGVVLEQTQYMIDDGDYYRYVTLTRQGDDAFADAFEAVGNSIRFE